MVRDVLGFAGVVALAAVAGGSAADASDVHLATPTILGVVTAGSLSNGTYVGSDTTPAVSIMAHDVGGAVTLYLDECTTAISAPVNVTGTDAPYVIGVTSNLDVGLHTMYAQHARDSYASECSSGAVAYRVVPPMDATYRITFEGAFTKEALAPGVRVPGGAHFTTLIGGIHNTGITFWERGGAASPGVENMAELGLTNAFRTEITTAYPDAADVLEVPVGSGPTPKAEFEVAVSGEHASLTLTSMIAPSPDWFVGISGMPLLRHDGSWEYGGTVDLFPYDAGTENGERFSLNNDATIPHRMIASIRDMGNFLGDPIAVLQFERLALASNLGQERGGALFVGHTPDAVSQAFHTGPNSEGYVLHGMTASFDSAAGVPGDIRVGIAFDDAGLPGDMAGMLYGGNPAAAGLYTFTADGAIHLDADTTYHAVFYVVEPLPANAYRLVFTDSDAEDAGSASGWSIADMLQGHVHHTHVDNSAIISLQGEAATAP